MAESGSHGIGVRLDIEQLLLEAEHRWLKPAEICEILRNYQKFHITPEPPYQPVSGSVFLFDRKVLRYFRKDAHNWRKKKDGKTIKEAHEKLKVGSIDALHCYYAHGEGNENFQRRSYWMLQKDLMHIVFVHYLEVKGNQSNAGCIKITGSQVSNSRNANALHSSFPGNFGNLASVNTESTSPTSTLTIAHDDAESEDNLQVSSRFQSPTVESYVMENIDFCMPSSYNQFSFSGTQTTAVDYTPFPHEDGDVDSASGNFSSGSHRTLGLASWDGVLDGGSAGVTGYTKECGNLPLVRRNWLVRQQDTRSHQHVQSNHSNTELGYMQIPVPENDMASAGNYPLPLKQPLIDVLHGEDGLKKVDSFSRWISKELEDVEEFQMQSSSGILLHVLEGKDMVNDDSYTPQRMQLDMDLLNPSLSKDQLFSIADFAPNWAYSNTETKVVITGKFLKSEKEFPNCKWSCMFGEMEVPVEVLADGVLCCLAPPHRAGVVPFYVTCSDRLACSEVRDFEYQAGPTQGTDVMHLRDRFERLLLPSPAESPCRCIVDVQGNQDVLNKITSLIKEEKSQMDKVTLGNDMSDDMMMEQLLQRHLKEKFYCWLLNKVYEDAKAPYILDEGGQGLLHLASALGYSWAIRPILASGVHVDFRDLNGWTALHWAASHGREETVAALVSLGAASGALTDPSAEFPLGRTPADIASFSGHKGISGFLAESSLTTHLSTLTLGDPREDASSKFSVENEVLRVTECKAVLESDDDDLLLKDSLAAVRNATQAAARIYQIFRIRSFQRKKFVDTDEILSPDEQVLSAISAKTSRLGDETVHAAATRIQKKFRGWKKQKEFLLIRQRVVKIQARVRGRQARKKYTTIIWSVGILEKVILRWRRKGSGLRGFRSDKAVNSPNMQDIPTKEDDYDFLKEGRKQTEQRMQKALDRVKSMALYPEGRAQYRRLLTVAEGLRKTKHDTANVCTTSEDTVYLQDDLIDLEAVLDDDTFMSIAFE